jgi:ankyrin repeat protein/class 3 adenylate cyclase
MKVTPSSTQQVIPLVSRATLASVVRQYEYSSSGSSNSLKDIALAQQRRKTGGSKIISISSLNDNTLEDLEKEMSQTLTSCRDMFIFVCKNGSDAVSVQLLDKLYQQNPKTNMKSIVDSSSGGSALIHLCAQRNKVQCMEWLHEHGVSLESTDKTGATPILHACAHDCPDSIVFLIEHGANVNAKDVYHKFPMFIALRSGHYNCAEILIQSRNLDIHLRGIKGNTLLHTAAEEGNLQAVQFLMGQCSASPLRRNYDEKNVLQCCLQHVPVVDYITKKVTQKELQKMLLAVDINGTSVLHSCALDGLSNCLVCILKNVDFSFWSGDQINSFVNSVDKRGDTPLLIAVKNSRSGIVKLLSKSQEVSLNEGDYKNHTALYYAVSSKDQELIAPLTSAEASLTPCDTTDSSYTESSLGESHYCCGWLTSLKFLLSVTLTLVAVVCIAIVTAISLGFFASTIRSSTTIIRERLFAEAMTFMNTSTNDLAMMGRTSFAQINERFDLTNIDQVKDFTWALFSSNKQYSELLLASYCGKNDGGIAAFVYLTDSHSVIFLENFVDVTKQNIYDVVPNYSLKHANITTLQANYSITQEQAQLDPTFLNTKAQNNSFWSKSYAAAGTAGGIGSYLFLTYAHPIRDPVTNFWYGYCAVDSSTESLNQFLVSHALTGSVTVVIERSTGYLIGSSDPVVELYSAGKDNDSPTIRYTGIEPSIKNGLLTSMMRFVHRKYGGIHFSSVSRGDIIYDSMKYNGAEIFVNVGNIADDSQLDWIVVQALPRKLFYIKFNNSIITIICSAGGLIFLNIVFAIVISNIFMAPIRKIISQAEHIKLLQLEKVEKELEDGLSFFTEIRYLQSSFYSMTKRLKQFRSFIPDHILGVIETEASGQNIVFRKSTDTETMKEMTHVRHQQLHAGKKGIMQHALNSSTLRSEYVTVMSVDVINLSRLLETHSAQDISETIKDYIYHLKEISRTSNGQIVSITTTNALVVWNCLIPQLDHELTACSASKALVDNLSNLHQNWKKRDLPSLSVHITISSGAVYSGNLTDNTEKMKLFSIVGRPVDRVHKMINEIKKWNVQVLVSEDVFHSSKELFSFRPLSNLRDEDDQFTIYELGAMKNHDEWINDLSSTRTTSNNSWEEFTEAYRLYEDGNYQEGYNLMSQWTQRYSKDLVGHKMLEYMKPDEISL